MEAMKPKPASTRSEGSLRRHVTMRVLRAGTELYVRSAYGPNLHWYQRDRRGGAVDRAIID